jgi:hypothetical protein
MTIWSSGPIRGCEVTTGSSRSHRNMIALHPTHSFASTRASSARVHAASTAAASANHYRLPMVDPPHRHDSDHRHRTARIAPPPPPPPPLLPHCAHRPAAPGKPFVSIESKRAGLKALHEPRDEPNAAELGSSMHLQWHVVQCEQ